MENSVIAERPPFRLVLLLSISVVLTAGGVYALMTHTPGLWPVVDVVLFTPATALFYWQMRGPNQLVIGRGSFTHRNSWNGAYRIRWDEAGPFTVESGRIVFDYRDPDDGTVGKTFISGRFALLLTEIAALLNAHRDRWLADPARRG
ncbi:MAG: hypothetical protein JSR60_14485 [Proteobacteria bacterium]|nr:hypothetical protein [Pseudomonadota bacterium]